MHSNTGTNIGRYTHAYACTHTLTHIQNTSAQNLRLRLFLYFIFYDVTFFTLENHDNYSMHQCLFNNMTKNITIKLQTSKAGGSLACAS
jgi:hypothetical protein